MKDTPENRRIAALGLRLSWDHLADAAEEVLELFGPKSEVPTDPESAEAVNLYTRLLHTVIDVARDQADRAEVTVRAFTPPRAPETQAVKP
jgi:hypothetical protein